jgi:hypothetical protein
MKMTPQQLQDFLSEMEDRAKEFDRVKSIVKTIREKLYWEAKATEARFVIDRIKHIMEK